MHTITKGDISVLRVAAALMARGERVLRPMSENTRYDIALDRDGALFRIQVKTGCLRKGCVVARAYTMPGGKKMKAYDASQIDAFAIYCPDTDAVYMVPIDVAGSRTELWLRVHPRKKRGGQIVMPAEDYVITAGSSIGQSASFRS